MPAGVPVATVSIDGARNAALLAVRILGASDQSLRIQLDAHRADLASTVEVKNNNLKSSL